VWIKKSEIEELSRQVRRVINGEEVDLRINDEGVLRILRNDIHILAKQKQEQVTALERDKEVLRNTLADISHQLNTPLTSMMLMTELLEDAPAEQQAEFIANIKSGLARTEWLVSALLKIAKLDSAVVEFNSSATTVQQLVHLATQPLLIQLELREQTIECVGDATIECDKRWTAEALSNIIKNASEHSPVGSVITVECGENPICRWISVVDSGVGISVAKMTKIFRRFEGGSESGYGIGLPLARAIIRGQNGDVEVSSNPDGIGTTFTVKFFR